MDRVEVPAAAELSVDFFRKHLELRHAGLLERMPEPHLWAHQADHHLRAANLDHIHPDLPTAEEIAEQAEIWEQRCKRRMPREKRKTCHA